MLTHAPCRRRRVAAAALLSATSLFASQSGRAFLADAGVEAPFDTVWNGKEIASGHSGTTRER